MRDDQLREGLAAWLRPTQEAPVPGIRVIRRRLRRRRARKAIAGTVLCALGAGTAALIHVTAVPAPTMSGRGPVSAPPCRGSLLRVGPAAVLVKSNAISMEPLPNTYLLQIRNAGRVTCSVEGWPRLAIAAPRTVRPVPISYGTVSSRPTRRGPVWRVVRPTQVVLAPGARAAATVTVTFQPAEFGCANKAWSVTPPGSSGSTIVRWARAGTLQRRLPLVMCRGSTIEVSPVYPAAVPVTQNYPAAAPRQSPATISTSPPTAGAGPQAAPYFVAVYGLGKAVVYDWRTGKTTAVIRAPGGAQGFTGVAAAGDDRTFVLAAGTGVSRFYQLILSQQGTQDGPLTPLPVPALHASGTPFAVSDDGSLLALAPRGPGRTGEIMVVSLVTGSVRTWRSPEPGAVWDLSWADPGSSPATAWAPSNRLLFSWVATAPGGQIARQRSGLRLLDVTAPGTNLLASRVLVPASVRVGGLTGLDNPLINVDGTVVFATMTSGVQSGPQSAVVEFSAITGRPVGVVTPLADESGHGAWCGAVWVNPSGSRALAACRVQGEINGIRFTREALHFPDVGQYSMPRNYFAW
jgi:hypothetical protein